jgi:hypothetical protein
MEKPRTYNGDLENLPPALLPLTAHERWVVWPWELRSTKNGKTKWTKPPRQVRDPSRNARSNDPSTWGSYTEAVAAVDAGGAPEGSRSELFQKVVWNLAGKGWSIDQIIDELVRYPNGIAAKYANRLNTEVSRSYEKWRSRKRAAAGGSEAPARATAWPQIFVRAGELPRVVNEAENALLLLGREIYQRGGLIVRPVQSEPLPWIDTSQAGS